VRSKTGYVELIVCGLVWGSIGVIVKKIDVSAAVIVFFRLSLGALSVLVWSAVRGRMPELRLGPHRPLLFAAGLVLALHWTAFFEAYKRLSVATTILIVYVGPVLIAAAAPWVLGERLERRTIFALALSMIGIALIAVPSASAGDSFGFACAGVAAVSFAAIVLMLKKLTPHYPPAGITVWQLGVAAVALSPALIGASGHDIARAAPALVTLGVLHTGVTGILYVSGLTLVTAQQVSILVYLEPVTAVLWAWAVLSESPTIATLAGGALIVAAGLLIVVPGMRAIAPAAFPEAADAAMGGTP
jgi:drug/metabolite transporter (DMT)-like permease